MAAKHRAPRTASPRAAGPRARGRRRRPPLWRRSLTFLTHPFAWSRRRARDAELRELRSTVVALRAEVARLRELVAAEKVRTSLVLPLVRAALAEATDGTPPEVSAPVALDLGPDTARTEIVLPEASLLDPRQDRTPDLGEEGAPSRSASHGERGQERKIA